MKGLVEFINERGAAPMPFKFICGQSNKEIPSKNIIDSTSNMSRGAERLFKAFNDGQYGNNVKVFFAKHKNAVTYVADTERQFKFEKTPKGTILVNIDDDRDVYDLNALVKTNEIDAIVITK